MKTFEAKNGLGHYFTASHDRGSVSGCRAFADSYRGATATERLAPTDFPQIG
jgi:hypothetical protein